MNPFEQDSEPRPEDYFPVLRGIAVVFGHFGLVDVLGQYLKFEASHNTAPTKRDYAETLVAAGNVIQEVANSIRAKALPDEERA